MLTKLNIGQSSVNLSPISEIALIGNESPLIDQLKTFRTNSLRIPVGTAWISFANLLFYKISIGIYSCSISQAALS